jgi:hypothetical protein
MCRIRFAQQVDLSRSTILERTKMIRRLKDRTLRLAHGGFVEQALDQDQACILSVLEIYEQH